jgi:hypothetical protein
VSQVHQYIRNLGVSQVEISLPEIFQLLNSLAFDGRLEPLPGHVAVVAAGAVCARSLT